MNWFFRAVALPHDVYAWCYRNRIKAALDYENAHEQRADIRADREAFDRVFHPTAERVWPDGPGLAQRWPDCDPADPCGTRWENERDGAIWHHCGNHLPRGRHRLRLVSDRTEAGL